MASTDAPGALDIARRITDPWFRCQALATTALHVAPNLRTTVIDEAFRAGNELEIPNRGVTASSWPLKALGICGDAGRLEAEGERLLGWIASEPSPVRRADALRFLLGATAAACAGTSGSVDGRGSGGEDRSNVLSTRARAGSIAARIAASFASACLEPLLGGKRNKKGEYLLEEAIPVIARLDPVLASSYAARLPPSRFERATAAIERMRDLPIDTFFPWPSLSGPVPDPS